MGTTPFTGRESLRVAGERARLVVTLALLPVTLGVVGFFFQNTFTIHSLILILVGAMLFVALSRGRFLGGGVRIREGQFGEIYAIVQECARAIGVATPHVFVRDDPFVPIVALGTGEPYALVFSSTWVELFTPDELRFLVGRELAHIAAGHTKLTSLLSANGRENAVVSVAFGAYLRIIEYTADRAGLLCCGSLNAAFSAIAVSTFHHVGRKIDLHVFAEQRRELDAEPSLRIGEWISATPYVTNRIARLAAFDKAPLYQVWAPRFAQRAASQPAEPEASAETAGDARGFAGPWRRIMAFAIDYIIVAALLPSSGSGGQKGQRLGISVDMTPAEKAQLAREAPAPVTHAVTGLANGDWSIVLNDALVWVALAAYVVLLVAYAGQTIGMAICDLRVVGDGRERIGLRQTIARYACFVLSLPMIVGVVSIFRRVQPFERWSHTRLVSGSTGGRA